jgi:hypothetical protein
MADPNFLIARNNYERKNKCAITLFPGMENREILAGELAFSAQDAFELE